MILGDFARRMIFSGVEALGIGEESVRHLVTEKGTREAVSTLVETAMKSRDEVGRIREEVTRTAVKGKEEVGRLRGDVQKLVGREIRRQIERMDLREEMAKIFADYSLEVTARVALVPRDVDEEDEATPLEEGGPPGRPKKRKKRRDDVKVRLVRRPGAEDPHTDEGAAPRAAEPVLTGYFDDDDDTYDD